MKIKSLTFSLILFISPLVLAQVNINTNTPKVKRKIDVIKQSDESKKTVFYKWVETLPVGWHRWDCFGPTVTETEVKANADYVAAHLKTFGFS